MSGPTDGPRRGGRHSGEGGGRSAADFLADWHTGETAAVPDDPTGPVTDGPRRARRRAAEAEAAARAAEAREVAAREAASREAAAREAAAREAAARAGATPGRADPSTRLRPPGQAPDATGRSGGPLPARPTSRPLDPADETATRRTPLVAPATTEMPARPALTPRLPPSALSGLILGNTGRTPRVTGAGPAPSSHAAPVPSRSDFGADGLVDASDADDEPTDRHSRVRDDPSAGGPVLYDQEQDDRIADDERRAGGTDGGGTAVHRSAAVPADAPADAHGDLRRNVHDDAHPEAPHDPPAPALAGLREDTPHDLHDDLHDDLHGDAPHGLPDDHHDAPAPRTWDETGGLEVIGAEVEEERGRRGRRARGRRATRGAQGRRTRRARRPITVVLSLLVLAGLVVGIVLGGQWLIAKVNPTAEDYTGQGTGEVQIRVATGDTLTAIGRTLVEADVIASTGPFVDAASANPAATGIQPGVYGMRLQMSGQAALDRLIDPAARLFSRVTVPEGFTVERTLQRLSEATQMPLADLEAAAADTSQLGLPAWANGQLEGFLYPLTYDFEPGTTATEMLQTMVAQFTEVATETQLEQRAAAAGRTPYDVLIVASMVQSETLQDAERVDVAQVIYNRLAQSTPLGIDATTAYGLGKSGDELTVADLASDNPYNTRVVVGLPPTPISAPGELSLEAALSPSTGDLFFYVLADSEGNHFFTSSAAEFEEARQRCADAGLGCGPG